MRKRFRLLEKRCKEDFLILEVISSKDIYMEVYLSRRYIFAMEFFVLSRI